MAETDEVLLQRVRTLVDRYRAQCLWFQGADYYPGDRAEILKVLDYIRRYGDRDAYREASELSQCLLQVSSAPSADS